MKARILLKSPMTCEIVIHKFGMQPVLLLEYCAERKINIYKVFHHAELATFKIILSRENFLSDWDGLLVYLNQMDNG